MKNFASNLAPIIIEYLENRKMLGYSDTQEKHLEMFDKYIHTYHAQLETITKEAVHKWISYEVSRGYGGMYDRVSAVRMLALYMGNGAYILPTKAVPKRPQCVPYILTDNELSRLFYQADNIGHNTNHSVKLMFPTMLRLQYTCGLRPTEIRLIKTKNINFDSGEILIEKTKGNKGHKERVVVMSDDMLNLCRRYNVIRSVINPQSNYFFVRSDGKPMPQSQLFNILRSCWSRANPDVDPIILPRLRPYDIRHRFATAVLQKWIDENKDLSSMLPYLRTYMGHEEFSSTAYYTHLLPENLLQSLGVDWKAIDMVNPEVNGKRQAKHALTKVK
jgi:integrase/recombinase XerD